MKVELGGKVAESAEYRRTGHVDERAVTLTAIEVDDLLELFEQRGFGFSNGDAIEHRGEHRCFHAACRTLAAGFSCEELCNAKGFLDHACIFVIEPHDATAKRRAGA